MDTNPYTFSSSNKRMVETESSRKAYLAPTGVYAMTGLLWGYSMMRYNQRFFRVNGNAAYMVGFAALSAPASYAYMNFVFGSAVDEAADLNNQREGHAQ
jgi:drug/metabolite transporter superfamily protein YnfA